MPKCLECGYEMSELDKQCPKCARATPKDERVVVVCPHCGQKNRLPAGRSAAMKAVCGKCKQDMNPFAGAQAPPPGAPPQPGQTAPQSRVEETWLADVGGPTPGPPLEYVGFGEDADTGEVTAIPERDMSAVKVLDQLINQALAMRASDIHVEAAPDKTRVRYRVDGTLREVQALDAMIRPTLISRLKVLANLDIVERRLPQDGSFRAKRGRQEVDVRLSTIPTLDGESAALRLLERSGGFLDVARLGLDPDDFERLLASVRRPSGFILVTGPTGAGKTTTLYAILAMLSSIERKICTLEDPVEYRLPMISQSGINPEVGFDFARGLRALLRHDPDVILVGEIRDMETAEIAVQAALTGHLIFSTLHTAGAAEAIVRLIDLGVETYYVREVIEAVVAQRLLRVLCEDCKEAYNPSPELLSDLAVKGDGPFTFYNPKGCRKCQGVGYRGRTGVFEVLQATPEVRKLVSERASSEQIYQEVYSQGQTSLWKNGLSKVIAGVTSVEEAQRTIPFR